jgi:hypothetical protein
MLETIGYLSSSLHVGYLEPFILTFICEVESTLTKELEVELVNEFFSNVHGSLYKVLCHL